MAETDTHPYSALTPEVILEAAESLDLEPDGRLLALNSYENRVWQIGLEDSEPVIAKFYRPGRWSDEAILEEHAFTAELVEADLSVVAPLEFNGSTLHEYHGFRFALFLRQGGHAPEPAHRETLTHLGRTLGRMHAVGARTRFEHRPALTIEAYGKRPVTWLLENEWLPPHLQSNFRSLSEHLLGAAEAAWARAGEFGTLRLHGDCHPGNILWRNDQAHFVDLDDCLTGPAISDLWMLLSGERPERETQLGWIMEGYTMFRDFNPAELNLVEPLRTLRMLNHQAWLARRWDDPAFPKAFPWFGDDRHWENVLQQLQEELGELQEAPLQLAL